MVRTAEAHALSKPGIHYACMIDAKKKQSIIKKYQTHEGDTGSSEVQIALLSAEIDDLSEHLKQHPKDHSSRRGLLRKVSSRRHLMRYLKKENATSYDALLKKLKIKQPRVVAKPGATTVNVEDEMDIDPELMEKENDSSKE